MNNYTDKDSLDEALDLLDEIREMERHDAADFRKLMQRIDRTTQRGRKNRIVFTAAAAVAAVIVVVAGMIFSTSRRVEIDSLVQCNLPVLELSDGERIRIDAGSRNDMIADRTEVSVSLEEGTLKYEKKDEAAGITYNTLHVPNGSDVCDIFLEDGTHIWLNAGSRLRFPSVFSAGERKVFLEGEAYFDVARDENRQFVVSVGDQLITVLGTQFNVNAYDDQEQMVTALVEGSLSISDSLNNEKAVFHAGQMALLDRQSGKVVLNDMGSADGLTAWKDGFINMEKCTLEEIARSLSRLYDVEIAFDDDRAKTISYRGSIPRYDKLTDVLDVIRSGSPVDFVALKNVIYIRHK